MDRLIGGEPDEVMLPRRPDAPCAALIGEVCATRQRGGIDSDPMVRLLAYRAWGDRDRTWFERRSERPDS